MTTLATDEVERPFWDDGLVVVGVDEVGRGCIAGAVCVGAVALDVHRPVDGLRDSKSTTLRQRVALHDMVVERALCTAVGSASAKDIDRLGIVRAIALATERALEQLTVAFDVLLVDGPHDLVPAVDVRKVMVPGGDATSVSIAAAANLAKVVRDRVMEAVGIVHPDYGFEVHKGYASPEHLDALSRRGPCSEHRLSCRPVGQPALF